MKKFFVKGSIENLSSTWKRDVLTVSFTLKKAVFHYSIEVTFSVQPKMVVIESKPPWQVSFSITEGEESSFHSELTRQLNAAKPL